MDKNIDLQTFPKNIYDALALTYIEHHDLSTETPESILDLYLEARDKIKAHYLDIKKINKT